MRFPQFSIPAAILLAATSTATGCGDAEKPVKRYVLTNAPVPLDEVRSLLQWYAEGKPVGSESVNFERLVTRVRETDPQRAPVVEEGLAAIVKSPATAASQARRLLKKLEPMPPNQ